MSATQHHPIVYIFAARFARRPSDAVATQCVRAGLSLEVALAAVRMGTKGRK